MVLRTQRTAYLVLFFVFCFSLRCRLSFQRSEFVDGCYLLSSLVVFIPFGRCAAIPGQILSFLCVYHCLSGFDIIRNPAGHFVCAPGLCAVQVQLRCLGIVCFVGRVIRSEIFRKKRKPAPENYKQPRLGGTELWSFSFPCAVTEESRSNNPSATYCA